MGFSINHSCNLSLNLEIRKFDFIVERKTSDDTMMFNPISVGITVFLLFLSQLNIIIMVCTRGAFF